MTSGPSPDAERWLAPFRRAADEIWRRVGPMPAPERARPVGRGAGGDQTVWIDAVAEEVVMAELRELAAAVGGLTLVSEEVGEVRIDGPGGIGPTRVVLDPIDGSLNAKRGFPVFSTAIAVADGPTVGDVWLGYVRDHGTGEDVVAERGRGAWIGGLPPALPAPGGGLELLLMEGAAPARVAHAAAILGDHAERLRVMGSLALSICAVAAGRADALVGLAGGRAVDFAAAQLVAREAGLLVGLPDVSDLDGAPLDTVTHRHVVVARDADALALLRGLIPDPA